MSTVTIYHNPRCSKSRETLALLQHRGIEPRQVLYLDTPPDAATLKTLLKKLGMKRAHDLVRSKEADYKLAGLTQDSKDDAVIAAMVKYPKLIERPIVVKGAKAMLGRPPEQVLALFKD